MLDLLKNKNKDSKVLFLIIVVVIQEQKKMDLERKLVSANGIRKRRYNAKQARENMEHERRENLQKELMEKYVREREEFIEIEKKLNNLQKQEE